MNGKPGDHPITDILMHKLSVYGEPTDSILREISTLMSPPRMHEWFNPLWARLDHKDTIQAEAEQKLAELRRDAKSRGWEVE